MAVKLREIRGTLPRGEGGGGGGGGGGGPRERRGARKKEGRNGANEKMAGNKRGVVDWTEASDPTMHHNRPPTMVLHMKEGRE